MTVLILPMMFISVGLCALGSRRLGQAAGMCPQAKPKIDVGFMSLISGWALMGVILAVVLGRS